MTQEVRRRNVYSIGNYLFTGVTLGKGNFARVEEAVHTVLNVRVAIKIMDVNHIKEDYVIKNLYREGKIMAKLNHPCIASLFQTMQRSDNVYYLVTELANGGDLCAFVKKQANGKLDEKLTKMYAKQFASALSHMHSIGVIHRDLKMENVMLNSVQTQIKIVDFGLSNIWTAESPLKTHCGSPEYAAPELFVTGKQYGAEVDLWSLGIILYGMVLGELPFVTSRCQQLPSQERRKQLVAQINKGLSTVHKRALSQFSADFRSLMRRLLIADSEKRMTIKELTVHPWITDRGKRMIRTKPLKGLDSYERNKLYGKIGTLLQINAKQVHAAISDEPLGKIAAIFNILKRKYQMNQLQGDGATKTLPSLTLFELANLNQPVEKDKKHEPMKKPPKPLSAQLQPKHVDFTPRVPSVDRKIVKHDSLVSNEQKSLKSTQRKKPQLKRRPTSVQDQVIPKGHISSGQANSRPNTVQPLIQPKVTDYRYIKSPSLRRKVYSALVTTKISTPSSLVGGPDKLNMSPIEINHNHNQREPPAEKLKHKDTRSKDRERPSSPKAKNREAKPERPVTDKSISKKPTKYGLKIFKDFSGKPPDENVENIRIKSENVTRRRVLSRPFQHILEKSLKTASVFVKAPMKVPSKDKKQPLPKEENLGRVNMGFGDYVPTRAATAPNQTKKFAIYDPIARSIADYVSNNVSDKIYHCAWLKK